jgi:hypothetical protein
MRSRLAKSVLAQPNLRHLASLYLDSTGRLLFTPEAPAAQSLSATAPTAAAKPAASSAPAASPAADPTDPAAAEAPEVAATQQGATPDGDAAEADAAPAKPPKPTPGPPRVRVGRWTVVTVAVEPAAGIASAYLDGRRAVCLGGGARLVTPGYLFD